MPENQKTEEKRPRGRPRPQESIDRDNAILAYLKENGPQTRNGLAMALLIDKTKTYLALDRLRRAGLVQLCGAKGGPDALWTSDVSKPCP